MGIKLLHWSLDWVLELGTQGWEHPQGDLDQGLRDEDHFMPRWGLELGTWSWGMNGSGFETLRPEVGFRAGSIPRDPGSGGRVWVSSLLRRKAPAWVAAHPRSSKHRERLLRPPRQGRALCPLSRGGHGPSGRSVPPRRGCLSQWPPTVTRAQEEERGDLGAERGAGSTPPGTRGMSSGLRGRGSAGVSPMDHPGREAGGGKATCDREEEEVTLRKGAWLPVLSPSPSLPSVAAWGRSERIPPWQGPNPLPGIHLPGTRGCRGPPVPPPALS